MFRQFIKQISTKSIPEIEHFVIGNQSADYDSFFGSIIMAYLLTSASKKVHMPIIDCQAHEVPYRFQIWDVLKRMNIDHKLLKYKDSLKQIGKQSWFNLYDHNQRPNWKNITYIVDHHDFNNPIAKKYLITRMGSDLTHLYYMMYPSKLALIDAQTEEEHTYKQKFNQFINQAPLNELKNIQKPQIEIEEIMRYGIMMDTFNFDPNQKDRWTIYDKKAVEFIDKSQQPKLGYEYLLQLKFNEQLNKNLSLQASLAKDYKIFDYGNFTIEYSFIYLRPQLFYNFYQAQIKQWLKVNPPKSDIYMLMSVFKENNQLQRAFMFYFKDASEKNKDMFEKFLYQMKLQPLQNKNQYQHWNLWKDPSCQQSRKIFDKAFRKYFSQLNQKKE